MCGDWTESVRAGHAPSEPDGVDEERMLPESRLFTGDDLRLKKVAVLGGVLITTEQVAATRGYGAGRRIVTQRRILVAHARLVGHIRAVHLDEGVELTGFDYGRQIYFGGEGAFCIDWAGRIALDVHDDLGPSTRLICNHFCNHFTLQC